MLSIYSSLKGSIALVKDNDEAFARWVSHVISPHIVGIVLTTIISLQFSPNFLEVFLWLLILIPLIVTPPLVYLVWLVHKGMLEDIYMPRRETRVRPLATCMLWFFICLGFIRYWQAPQIMEMFMIAVILLVSILSFVTLFWKISFHGASISAAATVAVLLTGSSAWPVMLLVPLVGWSRIRLARHTPRQVIYGALVGALIALIIAQGIWVQLL